MRLQPTCFNMLPWIQTAMNKWRIPRAVLLGACVLVCLLLAVQAGQLPATTSASWSSSNSMHADSHQQQLSVNFMQNLSGVHPLMSE